MIDSQLRFQIFPKQTPALKFYHVLSVTLVCVLIVSMPITLSFTIGLGLLCVAYGWFAWPVPQLPSFDARLNQQRGHLRLKSAIHLFVGWRVQLEDDKGRHLYWIFDGQLTREEQRKLSVASHLEQMKRQASM